jgi:hypothetical protein
MKKEININPEDERPEPFATVLDLVGEHSFEAVLESLGDLAEYDAGDSEFSPEVRQEAGYLHLELTQLLARYDRLFPLPEEQPALHFYPAPGVEV